MKIEIHTLRTLITRLTGTLTRSIRDRDEHSNVVGRDGGIEPKLPGAGIMEWRSLRTSSW